jgi:small subunit ribosomal protein S4
VGSPDALRAYLSVPGSTPGQRRARFLIQSIKNKRGRDDQAYGIQVQTRPPDGPEHLGPSEIPGELARGYYGNISERQFRGIYDEAIRMKGDSGANMIGLLERRLDAVVYRAKFVPTVFAARQFINHGHVKVNGKRVNISSFRVKVGDVVEVKEKSQQMNLVLEAQALTERDVPDYIDVDTGKLTAKMSRVPVFTDVPYPVQMEPHLVVEYYSR